MSDYSKGKIYTIRCINDNSLIYVGSTIETLPRRFAKHKETSKIKPHFLLYSSVNKKWEEWYMELYELYPCSCRAELQRREGEIIREIGNLNMRIEGRTKREYYIENIDKFKDKNKKYRLKKKQEKEEEKKCLCIIYDKKNFLES